MAVIRSYNQPTVEARPIPSVGIPGNAPADAFGNANQTAGRARDMQVAGAYVEKAADSADKTAQSMMQDANESRIQDLANGFMSGSQFSLYTDKDAFYRKKGQDAINGAQAATEKLLELKKEAVGLASNDYQRQRLEKMLSAQIVDANGGISRHVATQSMEWDKTVAAGRQQLLANQTALQWNDLGAVEKNAMAAETVAREQARQQGVAGTDAETAMVAAARSNHYTTAIQQRLQNDQKRQALALYDKVKDRLDEKDSIKLASAMKSTATDVEADDWITSRMPNQGRQEARKFFEAKGYSPEASSVLAGNFQWESRNDPNAVNPKDGRDGSDSIGIGQWNADRAQALKKFAASNNLDPKDHKTQLEFAAHELETTEKAAGDRLKGAKSLEEANSAAVGFFRPAGWTAKTPEGAHGYQGRLAYARAAFDATGVGFDKANSQGVVLAALNDPGLSRETKAAIVTKVTKESSALEAWRAAQLKGIRDALEATTQTMIAAPNSYKKGTLSSLADAFDAADEKSEATNTRLLAGMEDTLLGFSQAPKTAQEETMRTVAAALLPGKGKALADSLNTLNNKDKAEQNKIAGEDFATLKTAAGSGVRMETMEAKARRVVDQFVKGGDFAKAREAADFYDSQVKAQAVGQAPPAQLAAAIADMKTKIEGGEQSNVAIRQLDAMQDTQRKQATAFDRDALTAGASIYSKDLGPLPPMTDLAGRSAYATQVSKRQGGMTVLPFTDPEITELRTKIDQSPPEQQAKTMQALSVLPAEMIPHVAAALAGKQDAGDPLSRSYAAALSFYADKDPAANQIASEILSGARIQKEMGEAGKKAPASGEPWQQALQAGMGNTFRDMNGLPAVIADAVRSVYTYRMHRAGRQGETVDIDVLNGAVKAVVGETIIHRGQSLLPPRGVGSYDFDNAVRSVRDSDLAGVHTLDGSPVTADKLARYGVLTNAGGKEGGEGRYFVRIPDPARGMDPRPVQNADGSAFVLDVKPLLQRARDNPQGGLPPEWLAARRRAPASPTENVAP